ncbi:uncharacterized protein METZ01_LOCUS450033, partial [marine metagenome]
MREKRQSVASEMKCILTSLLTIGSCLPAAKAEKDSFDGFLKPAFQQNCIKCHGEKEKVKGKVNLLALKNSAELEGNAKLLGKLIEALEFEDMPPEEEPLLDPKLRNHMVAELKTI